VDDLIRTTARGVLVADLGELRCTDPQELTLAGMTRGGLFLIEDGEIVAGLRDVPWTESPLSVFNRAERYTVALEARTNPKMLAPAIVISDFSVST
jgi:predicted Zn-dependent protease